LELHASKPKRSGRVGGEGSAGFGADVEEGSRAYRGRRDRELGSHAAQQSGDERLHVEARQLRKVLDPAQAGDSQENSVKGETILTKDRPKVRFVSLGSLRRQERVD